MKLNDDYNEMNKVKTSTKAAILGITAVILILLTVLLSNSDKIKKGVASTISDPFMEIKASLAKEEETLSISKAGTLDVSDLDFYDMYKEEEEAPEITDIVDAGYSKHLQAEAEASAKEEEPELTVENDGKHTCITYEDGTTEWISISSYLPSCSYDFENLFDVSGKYKYYSEGKCVSYFGVDISKDQDYVDFVKLKKAGVDFVMIRVGARGYSTGQLSLDDYFKDNLKRATDAGLDVGLYFLSQAISEEEANEEVALIAENIVDYDISYPIAFVMRYEKGENARVEKINKAKKTSVARAFLKGIKDKGYIPMIFGNKEWLCKNIDLSKVINDYDIWYSEYEEVPSFPYKFAMWQYSKTGTVDGIAGLVDFNICFTDYSLK